MERVRTRPSGDLAVKGRPSSDHRTGGLDIKGGVLVNSAKPQMF